MTPGFPPAKLGQGSVLSLLELPNKGLYLFILLEAGSPRARFGRAGFSEGLSL